MKESCYRKKAPEWFKDIPINWESLITEGQFKNSEENSSVLSQNIVELAQNPRGTPEFEFANEYIEKLGLDFRFFLALSIELKKIIEVQKLILETAYQKAYPNLSTIKIKDLVERVTMVGGEKHEQRLREQNKIKQKEKFTVIK